MQKSWSANATRISRCSGSNHCAYVSLPTYFRKKNVSKDRLVVILLKFDRVKHFVDACVRDRSIWPFGGLVRSMLISYAQAEQENFERAPEGQVRDFYVFPLP